MLQNGGKHYKGMDDITDHGGMVNGFQWQNENPKPA
jgi:hypothetical protein